MIKTFVYLILVCLQLIAYGDNRNLLSTARDIKDSPALKGGAWSVSVMDAKNGEILLEVDSHRKLSPASNLKLVTSAAALSLLGPEMTLKTDLQYTGKIDKNGVLDGDLYIRGGGDPTLGSSFIREGNSLDALMATWEKQISEYGIRSVSGDIIGDDSYFDNMPIPNGWSWQDIGNYYAAGTSGLCINENLYYLFFKPGKHPGDPALVKRMDPEVPGLRFLNHMLTGRTGSGDRGYIYAAPWQYLHQLEGTIPAGVKEFSIKGAMPDPAKQVSQYLKKQLQEAGIHVAGNALSIRESSRQARKRTTINTHTSPPLKSIVYRLNKKSVNLYAEQLLKLIGRHTKGTGSYQAGLQAIEEWLEGKGLRTSQIFLHDGSGLARQNRVTTRFLARFLVMMAAESVFPDFYHSLPVAGDKNDISGLAWLGKNTPAEKNARVKTGTHERVRAFSGYVHTRSKRLLCFSMIANDYSGSGSSINRLHAKLLALLASLP